VAALVGDLVDPDPGQAGEPVVQRLEHHLDRAQVQGPPPTSTLTPVIGRRPPQAPAAAIPRPRPGPNMSYEELLVLVVLDLFDDRLLDPQQGAP
jgi:hypothetical protein